MADSQLLIVLTVFVALCALSQLGQFLAMFGLYKKVKQVQDQAAPLIRKAEATLESAKLTLDDGRRQMLEITTKTHDILDTTKAQLGRIDLAVTEVGERAKVQLERVEMVMGDTVDRVQSVVTATHDGVLKPVRELNALVAGLRGGLGFLFKSRRANGMPATQDEEMFI